MLVNPIFNEETRRLVNLCGVDIHIKVNQVGYLHHSRGVLPLLVYPPAGDSPSRSRSPSPDRLGLADQPQERPQPKKMPKELSTNVTSLGLRAVDDPMMARLVIGGKTMGFVLVKEPQTRAEAAAIQVTIPLEYLPDAEPSADILERTNNPADTALSSAANNNNRAADSNTN